MLTRTELRGDVADVRRDLQRPGRTGGPHRGRHDGGRPLAPARERHARPGNQLASRRRDRVSCATPPLDQCTHAHGSGLPCSNPFGGCPQGGVTASSTASGYSVRYANGAGGVPKYHPGRAGRSHAAPHAVAPPYARHRQRPEQPRRVRAPRIRLWTAE